MLRKNIRFISLMIKLRLICVNKVKDIGHLLDVLSRNSNKTVQLKIKKQIENWN